MADEQVQQKQTTTPDDDASEPASGETATASLEEQIPDEAAESVEASSEDDVDQDDIQEAAEDTEPVKTESEDAEDLRDPDRQAEEGDTPDAVQDPTAEPTTGDGSGGSGGSAPAASSGDGGDGSVSRLLEDAFEEASPDVASAEDADVKPADERRRVISSVDNPAALRSEEEGGFSGERTGRSISLTELEERFGDQKEGAEYDQLRGLIDSTFTDVHQDEIVQGRIASLDEDEVIVDIGWKSDGVIDRDEFTESEENPLTVGQEVEVFLERMENYYGDLVLSKERADEVRRWERVETAFENEEVVEGTIVERIKGGMIVELFGGMEAFLPGSQIDVRPVRDFDAYLEKRMEFKVVKLNRRNDNIVVSHRALIQEELDEQREEILENLEEGQVLEGVVKNITDFGVFIDLGGVDGLLHITDLSWGRVSHPSEVVDLDETLEVVVLNYEEERQRISLGLKQLRDHPWDDIEEKYDEGDEVEGKVVSITNYGAFVELEKGIEGLVHISEMSWTDHIRHPSQVVSLGQLVEVKLLNIDAEGKKISLGMKQLEPDPWEGIAERYPAGTVMKGTVRNITNFGVFVEIEPGIDGLVHISDLSWTKKIQHPSEITEKDEEMDVQVLNIDEDRRRISLGHKQVNTNPWKDFQKVYTEGTDHDVEVIRIVDSGIVVELPLEVEAFVPGSELKHGPEAFHSSYAEGDELNMRVIRFDMEDREIIMSETAKERAEKQAEQRRERQEEREKERQRQREVQDYQDKQESGGGSGGDEGGGASPASGAATLGELSGLGDLKNKFEEEDEAQRAQTTGEQAAHKSADVGEDDETAEAAEAEVADEEVVTGGSDEPQASMPSEESVEEVESFKEATDPDEGEAVTKEAAQSADEDEDEGTAEEEMGKASATVEAESGEEAEAVAGEAAEAEAGQTTFHVRSTDDGWAVTREGADDDAVATFDTKKEATSEARDVAKEHTPSRLVIHKTSGDVQDDVTYGKNE
jgi:small subunit ribosomal protein S1